MSQLLKDRAKLSSWIQKEIDLTQPAKTGSRGQTVKRVQEWLNLHGFGLAIDGEFGAVTKQVVQRFQEARGLPTTGTVNRRTFEALVSPLLQVLAPIHSDLQTFPAVVLQYAKAHLKQIPREVGGQNCGPWVRLYMKGHEGPEWAWCAGFVSFALAQAAETFHIKQSIKGSFSCDTLAAEAKSLGSFIGESDLLRGTRTLEELSDTSIFLVRRTDSDWTHTGFATSFSKVCFDTIEGNTNDEGSREGFEVCSRSRGYEKKDFILL